MVNIPKYAITVVYPVYVEVEGETREECDEKALELADQIMAAHSIKPVVHEVTEIDELAEHWKK